MFKAIGLLVAIYAVYSIVTGRVYAKSGVGGRVVSRQESPEYFWCVVVIYAGLSAALIWLF